MRLAVIVALFSVLAWAGFAQAQQEGSITTPGHEGAISGADQGGGRLPLVTSSDEQLIEGQVLSYKNVSVKNEKEHRVVELKLHNGQTIECDLGIKSDLPSGFDVRKNQWVLVAGVPGQLGDQKVFVAHRWANVFNLSTTGGTTNMPKESLPGQGGSEKSKTDHENTGY